MNGQWQMARQRDFRGGEVQALLPEMVQRNQLLRMENALIFPNGYVTAFHQTDVAIVSGANGGLCLSLNTDGTYTYYATPVAGTMYTGILDTARNTPLAVATGAAHIMASAQLAGLSKAVLYLGKLYCPNSVGGILNLTDMTLIAIPGKNVKRLYIYTNRLWAVCTDGSLLASNNGDATTWDPLNVIFLPNTDPIIDFIPVSGGAIVYSTTSVYAMYGSSYLDISFVLLLDRQIFSSGAVDIDGTVFIVGPRGVYAVSLNGAAEIPHMQNPYFQGLFKTLAYPAVAADVVQGAYLQRFEAILFMWSLALGGTQGFVFYPYTKSYSKVNQLLNVNFPYLLAINDANTDFIMGGNPGTIVKSTYPSNATYTPRVSVIQTRHEDCDSVRNKVWRELSIETNETVYGVNLDASLDGSTILTNLATNVTLVPGRNVFFLDIPRSQSISIVLTINNGLAQVLTDDPGNTLTDDLGNALTVTQSPGNYTLEELRLKYREAGPII